MKKSDNRNIHRTSSLIYKNNNDKYTQIMKSSFDNICLFYNEIQNNIVSSNFQVKKFRQSYKSFLDEINKLKGTIEKILVNKSQTMIQHQLTNTQRERVLERERERKIFSIVSPDKYIYQNPTKQLYQNYGIKLDTIKSKNLLIREEIKKYSLKFEDDENNIPKRNKYLETVSNISSYAIEYSYKLIDILLKKFFEKNKFKSIIYERAKDEFSSWVNQSLSIESSQKIIFFEKYCLEELQISPLNRIILKDNNLLQHFRKLFIDLCQLFTLTLLFSEKEIELKYIEKGKQYQHDEMKDITELNGIRYVNFTVLPGFYVNKKPFQFAKALVFCETELNPKLLFNIKLPKQNEINLNGTIKTKEINDKINLDFWFQKQNDYFIFTIKTEPDIPKEDNPLFLMKYYLNSSWQYFRRGMKQNNFYVKQSEIPQNSFISFDLQLNGETKRCQEYIETNQILNS